MAGRPAPPAFRWIEAVILLQLVLATGIRHPLRLWAGGVGQPRWMRVGSFCLLVLLLVPSLQAAVAGWQADNVVRDIVPLFFLFLPLVLVPALHPTGAAGCRVLAAALAVEGLLFVLRWWWHGGWGFGAVGMRMMGDGGAYLLNAPSVLFAAIYWPLAALRLLLAGGFWRGWLPAMAAAAAAAVCAAALLGAAHRMALVMLGLGAVLAVRRHLAQLRRLLPVLVVAAVGMTVLAGDRLDGALFHVVEKTRLTGSNARMEEAAAALTFAGETLGSALFGQGWGALLENPAVGGWSVSYTHTMVSYFLVKAGALGLGMLTLWLAVLSPAALAAWQRDPPLAWAALAPLLTAMTVHTSFKYFDTGVLLTLIVADAGFTVKNIGLRRNKSC